jgi:vacuolar-type H+-ATPase subunit E/Vma4
METEMTLMSQLEDLEAMIVKGRVPGTARTLVNLDKITAVIDEMKGEMPEQLNEAEGVVRQKDAIIKQAELEARRIRAYADEEATTIRQLAAEQSNTLLTTSQEEARTMIQDTEITRMANENATEIEAEAQKRAGKLIDDAEGHVNGILNEAETSADSRRTGADNYAREVLFTLEERIADTLGQVRGGIDLLDARPTANVAD